MIKQNDSVVEYEVSALEKAAGDISGSEEVTNDALANLLSELVNKLKAGNKPCAKQLARRASLWASALSPAVSIARDEEHEVNGVIYRGVSVLGQCFTTIESNKPLVGQLQDVIHNARLVLLDQVSDDVLDVFARVSKWLTANEFELLSDFEKVMRTLPNRYRLPAQSFEEVSVLRPDLVEGDIRPRCTKKQYEYLAEHECETYPRGRPDMPDTFERWRSYVNEYLLRRYGRIQNKRAGRELGRSIGQYGKNME
jgi:hypothetical protein